MSEVITIDLGKYEWRVMTIVERGSLVPSDDSMKAVKDGIRRALGNRNLNVTRARIKVPDIHSPQLWMHLGVIIEMLDAWGVETELIFE